MRINIFEGILIPFVGFWIGILFLLALDHLIPHLHVGSDQAEKTKNKCTGVICRAVRFVIVFEL